uniref:Uncharacterized protein n=1 Tax=Rhizophora mucronata TaxID=61149 RepID=A0A2P2N8E6_RHIMU
MISHNPQKKSKHAANVTTQKAIQSKIIYPFVFHKSFNRTIYSLILYSSN